LIVSLVVAKGQNGVIGANGRLPWPHLAEDMRRFFQLTVGKPVIMGRRTYESLPNEKRPLRNRINIVLTTNRECVAPGCILAHSVDEALAAAGDAAEVMVIGGATVFRLFLPLADRIYLTSIQRPFDGDTFFPECDGLAWNTEITHLVISEACSYYFATLRRRQVASTVVN
jgi:dihydrofolate reductase